MDFSDRKEMECIFRGYVDEEPIMNPFGFHPGSDLPQTETNWTNNCPDGDKCDPPQKSSSPKTEKNKREKNKEKRENKKKIFEVCQLTRVLFLCLRIGHENHRLRIGYSFFF